VNQEPVPVERFHGLPEPRSIRIIMTSEDKRDIDEQSAASGPPAVAIDLRIDLQRGII